MGRQWVRLTICAAVLTVGWGEGAAIEFIHANIGAMLDRM